MTSADRAAASSVAFKRHLTAQVVEGDAVYLLSERKVTVLAGRHIETIAPLLDGTRDIDAMLRDVTDGEVSQEHIRRLIDRLTEAGLVVERSLVNVEDESACAYWEANDLDAAEAVAASTKPVRVMTVGPLDREAMNESLAATRLSVAQDDGQARLTVVLCDDYLAPELSDIDAAHRVSGLPWLLARPVGERVWIGPVFQRGAACWQCLAHRLWAHRPAEAHVRNALHTHRPMRCVATLPTLVSAALNLVALEAMKWLAGMRYPGQSCVWTFDSADLSGRHHQVRRRPQCPVCGDPTLVQVRTRQPVALRSRQKVSCTGGSHRVLTPEQVIQEYKHLISPITGVVKEVTRSPAGPDFLNVYTSGPPPAIAAGGHRRLRESMRFPSGGKGITPVHAEASALCEALERYSARYQGDEEHVVSSLARLGEAAIHPNACQLYHDRQFEWRERWNAQHSTFQFVPEPFDTTAEVPWTRVWSLTEQRHKYLPTGLLYFGTPRLAGSPPVRADSNGNAAGTSLEDAVLQGLLEVIERDAVAIWWYNRTRHPAVDLSTFDEPWLSQTIDGYAELGRQLWVLDLTMDLGVPVMAAVSRRIGATEERIAFGFGAHLDPRISLRRAVTEMNQLIPQLLQEQPSLDVDGARWCREATVETHPYLLPDNKTKALSPRDFTFAVNEDLLADVTAVHERLRRAGLELLVLNQTRPDIDLPVVKVIVPGLRPFWARFAPGRLYDVPISMGKLENPTRFEGLNPYPVFI